MYIFEKIINEENNKLWCIKELIKFLEDNHTKENGYKFQIRIIVNKTLNGKFKVINLTQDGFDKVSNALYSLIQKDIDDDTEDLISLDLTKNRLWLIKNIFMTLKFIRIFVV